MKARLKIEQEISEKMDKECKMKEEFYFDSEQEGEEEEEEEEEEEILDFSLSPSDKDAGIEESDPRHQKNTDEISENFKELNISNIPNSKTEEILGRRKRDQYEKENVNLKKFVKDRQAKLNHFFVKI